MELRLKELREEKELTRSELSRVSGISWQTLWNLETGRYKDPRLSTVLSLAAALGTTVDGLLKEEV